MPPKKKPLDIAANAIQYTQDQIRALNKEIHTKEQELGKLRQQREAWRCLLPVTLRRDSTKDNLH